MQNSLIARLSSVNYSEFLLSLAAQKNAFALKNEKCISRTQKLKTSNRDKRETACKTF
jgi:hypothetical protein